jgi:hypothetical protein
LLKIKSRKRLNLELLRNKKAKLPKNKGKKRSKVKTNKKKIDKYKKSIDNEKPIKRLMMNRSNVN